MSHGFGIAHLIDVKERKKHSMESYGLGWHYFEAFIELVIVENGLLTALRHIPEILDFHVTSFVAYSTLRAEEF